MSCMKLLICQLSVVSCHSFRKILVSLSTIVSALIGLTANSSAPYSRTLVLSFSSSAIANIFKGAAAGGAAAAAAAAGGR